MYIHLSDDLNVLDHGLVRLAILVKALPNLDVAELSVELDYGNLQ